jgi:CRISPR-associated protein Csb2
MEAFAPPTIRAANVAPVTAPFSYAPRHVKWNYHADKPDFSKDDPWGARIDPVLSPSAVLDPLAPGCIWEYRGEDLGDDATVVTALCEGVPYLGTSASHVVIQVSDVPYDGKLERWHPSARYSADAYPLGVPRNGFLDALGLRFRAFSCVERKVWEPLPEALPAEIPYVPGEAPAYPGCFFGIVPLLADSTVGVLQSLDLASAVRAALKHGPDIADLVDDGVYLFPLISVGFPHATGRCYGIGIAARAKAGFNALQARLMNGPLSVAFGLRLISFRVASHDDALPWSATSNRYRKSSSSWSTATPMIFPIVPRNRDGERLEEIVQRSLDILEGDQDGAFPKIVSVSADIYSALSGSFPAPAFRKRYPDVGVILRHIRLRFAEPVRGPILIGKGAHRGWGLCLPDEENESAQ